MAKVVIFSAGYLVLMLLTGGDAIKITSCSKDPAADIVKVKSLDSSPNPIRIPGNLTLATSLVVSQPITGNIQADVTLSKSIAGMWLDLPCFPSPFGPIGTCTYRDLCGLLGRLNGACPALLTSNNIPCACPIAAGSYTLKQTTLPLEIKLLGTDLPGISGDYQASIRVKDADTQTEIVCFDVTFEIADPPRPKIFRSLGRFLSNIFGR
ncbi:ganglioside GM2 activator-like [Physella acuta]|uniref:ganglioside GM2 activator-like n=1 Tax=Physella acuta TaxID=109671 RepID=UPI0027DDAB94|nr:ganglioside GM2 activator-like [Physella acuta]